MGELTMEKNYVIEIDELAVGLTKPATKLGIPLVPFFLSIMICFIGWMFYQSATGNTSILSAFVFLIIWIASYLGMLFITSKDLFGLVIYWVNFQYFRQLPSRSSWGNTDSYQP